MVPKLSLAVLAVTGSLVYGFSRAALADTTAARSTSICPHHPLLLRSLHHGVTPSAAGTSIAPSRMFPMHPHQASVPISASLTTTSRDHYKNVLERRGGALSSSLSSSDNDDNVSTGKVLTSFLGTGGVVYILVKAIARVLPIAMEPFAAGAVPLSQFQLGAYLVTCLWFAYVEGYKGFQLKFSPLVVKRSFTFLRPGESKFHHYLLAPMYSMGLIHATKKRKIVSWSVTIGVAVIVAAVKRLPYPWRNIVDAGVVVGLSWGTLSIMFLYLKSLITGVQPDCDPELPN